MNFLKILGIALAERGHRGSPAITDQNHEIPVYQVFYFSNFLWASQKKMNLMNFQTPK